LQKLDLDSRWIAILEHLSSKTIFDVNCMPFIPCTKVLCSLFCKKYNYDATSTSWDHALKALYD
jgi:hypothetical protein